MNLQPTKGLDVLCDAALALSGENITWDVFGSAGRVPTGNEFVRRERSRVEHLEGSGQLRFRGVVPDLADEIHHLDAFLITSRRESFSRVAAECMLVGVPLVAPAIPGLLDTVDGGRFAELYEVGRGSDAAAAVRRVADDYPHALARASSAQEYARVAFAPDRLALSLKMIYDEILKR